MTPGDAGQHDGRHDGRHDGGDHEPALRLTTRSADDTRALGAALATVVVPGDVVLLSGDLGAGKTTLVQGIAAGLGITEVVTSPTFTLVRSYACPRRAPGRAGDGAVRTLLHADVYRLDGLAQVADLDISELVEDDAVCVVEWGDVAAPALGEAALTVHLDPGDGDEARRVRVEVGGGWARGRVLPDDALARWSAASSRPGARR